MNQKRLFAATAILLIGFLALLGCGGDDNDDGGGVVIPSGGSKITGIAISPTLKTIEKGASFTFAATVAGTGNFSKDVTWEIGTSSVLSGTKFEEGTLSIDPDESVATFQIRARSVQDTNVIGTTAIFVADVGRGPKVNSIVLNPATVSVEKGKTQAFVPTLTVANNPNRLLIWSITTNGVDAGTSVSDEGLLTIAVAESNETLTVRATSFETPATYGEATVAVMEVGSGPTVTDVVITPAGGGAATVARGGTIQLEAEVIGQNNPLQGVTWEIVETTTHAGTTISASGLLTVIDWELTLDSLTIKATSGQDNTKSGTLSVALTGGTVHPDVYSGDRSALFAVTADTNKWEWGQWMPELIAGTYTFTYWYKGGNRHVAKFVNEDAGWAELNGTARPAVTVWTQVTATITISAVSLNTRLVMSTNGGVLTARVFLDDFSLTLNGGDGTNLIADPSFESGNILEEGSQQTAGIGWNYFDTKVFSIFTAP
jgi:hypothetical protein